MTQEQANRLLDEITARIENLNFNISNCLDDDTVIDEQLSQVKSELLEINTLRRKFFSLDEETQDRAYARLNK